MFCGDPKGEHLPVDISRFEMKGFGKPKSTLIDSSEEGSVSPIMKGREELDDFLAGEDVRKWLFTANFNLRPDLPTEVEVITVEGAQGADSLVHGAPCEISLGLEVEQEVENLIAL